MPKGIQRLPVMQLNDGAPLPLEFRVKEVAKINHVRDGKDAVIYAAPIARSPAGGVYYLKSIKGADMVGFIDAEDIRGYKTIKTIIRI